MDKMEQHGLYETKPVTLRGIEYRGEENVQSVLEFCAGEWVEPTGVSSNSKDLIKIANGQLLVSRGDYILEDLDGEFFVCKKSIFERKYQKPN